MHSFDKYASWSSRSNLVSHRSSPLPQLKPKPGLSVIKGFLCSCLLVCQSEDTPFPGVVLWFSYAELEQPTGKFSDEQLISVSGTSKVYRVQLADRKVITARKLPPLGGADEDYEFLSEATRVGVVLGAARGLEYLHEAAGPHILHRDIKSTNILLDDRCRAMITDLGMAKCLMNDGVTSCFRSSKKTIYISF